MHNGGIADFHLLKRRLQSDLSDDIYNVVQGNTGEHSTPAVFESRLYSRRLRVRFRTIFVEGMFFKGFVLYIQVEMWHAQLPDPKAKSFTTRTLQQAMLDTIATLNLYAEEADITEVR